MASYLHVCCMPLVDHSRCILQPHLCILLRHPEEVLHVTIAEAHRESYARMGQEAPGISFA